MSGPKLDSKIDLNSDEAKAWLAHNCGLAGIESRNFGWAA